MKTNLRKQVEKELLDNYKKYYRLAYSYVRNEADALDIVQESAYKAIKNCESIKDADFITTWIHRIVINTAMDLLRRSQRAYETMEEETREQGAVDTGYSEADVMDMLSILEEKDRSILILRYFEGFGLEEIAAITNEKLSTVKSRLYRALHKMRMKTG